MRRNKTITLGEALSDLIREYRLGPGLKEATVLGIWESIAGKIITARTKKAYLKDGREGSGGSILRQICST